MRNQSCPSYNGKGSALEVLGSKPKSPTMILVHHRIIVKYCTQISVLRGRRQQQQKSSSARFVDYTLNRSKIKIFAICCSKKGCRNLVLLSVSAPPPPAGNILPPFPVVFKKPIIPEASDLQE